MTKAPTTVLGEMYASAQYPHTIARTTRPAPAFDCIQEIIDVRTVLSILGIVALATATKRLKTGTGSVF